jgi:adenosylcobinamide-phosphate synthase
MHEPLLVLLASLIIDRALGDPPNRLHPVAWLGRWIGHLAKRLPNGRVWGLALVVACAAPYAFGFGAIGWAVAQLNPLLVAPLLSLQLSWRGLHTHASSVLRALESGDLERAREEVSRLVGRETSELSEEEVASAAIESVAENATDGIVGPAFLFLIASPLGLGPALGAASLYRAINTLDAMVGYKLPGIRELGLVPAKLDDLLNLLPARLAGLSLISASLLMGYDWRGAVRTYLLERGKTESPNAGHPMSAVAGALGVRLEKRNHYALEGGGSLPKGEQIRDALRLLDGGVVVTLGVLAGLWALSQGFWVPSAS